SCQTARCFNKSKGVLITGSKLKAFRNPQPSWGFSVHNKTIDKTGIDRYYRSFIVVNGLRKGS
ncbi:hypothetical protein, partial [Escherichia coli]|uniref:hypothetical protein n=1 Tax=Escherichia coli TaxID=562 RepID=UPI001FAE37CD